MAFDVYQHGRQHVAAQDRVYQRPWRLLGNTTVTYDVATPTPDMLLRTLIHAREARRRAESYRHFLVGACGWAVKDDGQAFVVKHGANYKNGSGASSIDEHAEHMALSLLKPAVDSRCSPSWGYRNQIMAAASNRPRSTPAINAGTNLVHTRMCRLA